MARGNWQKKWSLVMGDPEKDGSLHKDEWGATLHEERKMHLNPHLLLPEHRHELTSTILHESLHVVAPRLDEKSVEALGDRLAEFFEANPHIYELLKRYPPVKNKGVCKCGRK